MLFIFLYVRKNIFGSLPHTFSSLTTLNCVFEKIYIILLICNRVWCNFFNIKPKFISLTWWWGRPLYMLNSHDLPKNYFRCLPHVFRPLNPFKIYKKKSIYLDWFSKVLGVTFLNIWSKLKSWGWGWGGLYLWYFLYFWKIFLVFFLRISLYTYPRLKKRE